MTINGRFYFELTSNGNLLGEYSNNHLNSGIEVEAAKRVAEGREEFANLKGSEFHGEFLSIWTQGKSGSPPCYLEISRDKNRLQIFSLVWSKKKGGKLYHGEGMLAGHLLIGNYMGGSGPTNNDGISEEPVSE